MQCGLHRGLSCVFLCCFFLRAQSDRLSRCESAKWDVRMCLLYNVMILVLMLVCGGIMPGHMFGESFQCEIGRWISPDQGWIYR